MYHDTSVHPGKTSGIQLNFTEDEEGNEIFQVEGETLTYLKSNEEL